MSGVFGVVDQKQNGNLHKLVNKMSDVMSHRDWFVAESFVDDEHHLALGRIGIGIFNKTPQPVWNPSGTVALVMAGEFYDTDSSQEYISAGSDEQFALALYESMGDNFVSHLKGAFIIAIWDKSRSKLLVTNDRFGLYPIYYAHINGKLTFAPEIKGVLCDNDFPRHLDWTALAQYMRFQHLLGDRTFFEDIKVLPSASLLIYDWPTASVQIKSYWSFADIHYRPEVSFDEAAEETGRLFRKAVQRLSSDVYQPGLYLSGGLDSRAILGMIEHRPVFSLTYGMSNCRDVHYAQRVAQTVGSDHHWFDLPNGDWVKDYVNFHLDLTEGFHSWIHAHGISTLPRARELMDVNLTGWDGGTVMGHDDSIEPLQYSAVDDTALMSRLFYLFNQKYTWPSITEVEERLLYNDLHGRQILGLAFDSFRTELSSYLHYRPDVRAEYFYIRNHCGRLTQNLITFTRSHIETRFPFFDYDLFDFLYSLPATQRGHRVLYRAVIQREIPSLAYIPYDHDEFLPTTRSMVRRAHAAGVKIKRRINRHISSNLFPQRYTLYADYENYLRGELRDWAEDILFDSRTTERGIFDSDFLHTLMDRHISGLEEWMIGKIAPVITYEMMLRRFYD